MMEMQPTDAMSPSRRHLTKETIARIEVSLSSRKTSVVVSNTSSRLIALEEGEWRSVAYGAPCILLLRRSLAPDSTFDVHLVIADLESGISVWEEELKPGINYSELQPGFHTFSLHDQMLALQFANPSEASSLFDSLQQYLAQKKHVDNLLDEKASKSVKKANGKKTTKQAKKEKQLSKFEISTPCEFRHISGITAGHTEKCQNELENAITRQKRSSSMSAISQKRAKEHRSRSVDIDGYQDENQPDIKDSRSSSRNRNKFKFNSFRLTRRKKVVLEQCSSDDMALSDHNSHKKNSISKPVIDHDDSAMAFFSRGRFSPEVFSSGEEDVDTSETASPMHNPSAVPSIQPIQPTSTSNMYDVLLPLSAAEKSKLPPLKPLTQNYTKKAPLANPVKNPPLQVHIPPNELPTTSSSSKSPSATDDVKRYSTPSGASIGSQLDYLSDELSKVLKEFDEMIAPQSPLDSDKSTKFSYSRKETMV